MFKRILYVLLWILPFLIITRPIFEGAIPFWYDPARDLLMAWDNLHKLTLIGSTSGIPGIFYGPYWIWLLSLGLLISKDPRIVTLLILALPYFICIPLVIYCLNKSLIRKATIPALWILSIFCFASYAAQIWNPNLAPLFYFMLLTIFYITDDIRETSNVGRFFLMGVIYGLFFSYHISFGTVLLITWTLYYVFTFVFSILNKSKRIEHIKNWFTNTLSFVIGLLLMLSSFFIFEARHGFMQIKSLIFTLSKSTAVVGQIGLTKQEIFLKFLERSSVALSLPTMLSIPIIILIIFGISFNLLNKKYSKNDIKLLLFLVLNIIGLFLVYLGTKNPVWNYHFISVEVLFIFLTLLSIKKNSVLEFLFLSWAIVVLLINTVGFTRSLSKSKNPGELTAKKSNVEFILKDNGSSPFTYFAKNPSIYSYDYDYLFRWIGTEKKELPNFNIDSAKNIYIIVPYEVRNDKIGFTLNRTPDDKFYTASQWIREDKTIIIKRLHK